MARISTYDQDSNVSFQDKLIGTNSVDSATKNFTLQSVIDLINQSFCHLFLKTVADRPTDERHSPESCPQYPQDNEFSQQPVERLELILSVHIGTVHC